ncbi:uncharacterized protein BXIN_2816 [Babesia sp. Xinjiang]|uniref:uncharacterized protein n=1 Tax=Babesia sp. Xinjiang TaxID=462227 RepID=UPI000A22D69F|nr:uncharacterized protein BXIN_2816 [Babesia sp. Xinjiang]ORM41667.1 hypothetical protein BXIN_2816 [Babesia sp. Xinjiang]
MVNSTMNIAAGSPLSCCKPKAQRRGLSPVFKQQYVNDNGKMKLTMPVSPLHYITTAGYYANDMRMVPQNAQWDNQIIIPPVAQQLPYPIICEQHGLSTGSRGIMDGLHAHRVENVPLGRMPTPNFQVMTQPQRRQESAQVNRAPVRNLEVPYGPTIFQQNMKPELPDLMTLLARIEARIKNLEVICKSNETKVEELNMLLMKIQGINITKSQVEEDSALDGNKSEDNVLNNTEQVIESMSKQVSRISESASNYNAEKLSASSHGDGQSEQSSLHPLVERLTHTADNYGSAVFDVSEELRNSNDMLERYLSVSGDLSAEEEMEASLRKRNMEFSLTLKTDKNYNPLEPDYKNENEALQRTKSSDSETATIKPIVTTNSMVQDEGRNNTVLANLEKRFQVLMQSFENNKEGVLWTSPQFQIFPQQRETKNLTNSRDFGEGTLAISGERNTALNEQEQNEEDLPFLIDKINALPEEIRKDLILVKPSEEFSARRIFNERKAALAAKAGNTVALKDQQQMEGTLVLPGDRTVALTEQQQMEGTLVLPGDRTVALTEQQQTEGTLEMRGSVDQYQPELALRTGLTRTSQRIDLDLRPLPTLICHIKPTQEI